MKIYLIIFQLLAFTISGNTQTAPFEIKLEALQINELGGLQTFAFGQDQGKWLIIGRTIRWFTPTSAMGDIRQSRTKQSTDCN